MERKLLSLPSFFVLLLVAGIAFLATPVVDVYAAAPTVDVVRTTPESGTAGRTVPSLVFTITFSEAVKVTGETLSGATVTPAMGFGIEDIEVKFAPAATPAGRTETSLRDPLVNEFAKADTSPSAGSGTVFTVTLATPSNENGTATVSIRDAGAAADESAFNSNDGTNSGAGTAYNDGITASGAKTRDIPYATFDGVKPTVNITAGVGATGTGSGPTYAISATGGALFQLEFVFSEPLGTGDAAFAQADISIAILPATAAPTVPTSVIKAVGPKPGAAAATPTFIVAIDPPDDATQVTVGVNKDAVADANGNKLDPAFTRPITINTRPKVMITGVFATSVGTPPSNVLPAEIPLTETRDITVTFKLSAVPTATTGSDAFLEADIAVTNGSLEAGSLSRDLSIIPTATVAATYTATVTLPAAAARQTPLTITVAEDSFKAGDLGNRAANPSISVPVAVQPVDPGPGTPPPEDTGVGDPLSLTGIRGFRIQVTVPSNGWVVLARNPANTGVTSATVDIKDSVWVDLSDFFATGSGGALSLVSPGRAVKDLVISELMWGDDAGQTPPSSSQWIELYNTTKSAITATVQLQFRDGHTGATVPAVPADSVGPTTTGSQAIDKLTNWGQGNQYWQIVDQAGGAYGQGGKTTPSSPTSLGSPRQLVSMERKIDYAKVEKTDHDNDNAGKNRNAQLSGVPDGSKSGSWQASKAPRRNMSGLRLGTPGTKQVVQITRTSISKSVIFNEIANRSEDKNDWIELYNPGSSDVKINNWVLSIVTAVDKDDKLFKFESDENIVVPAKGFLLVVNEDPSETSLLASENVDNPGSNANGLPTKFYINSGLKIPKEKYLLVLRTEEKLKSDEKIVEIGGHIGDLNLSNDVRATKVWPLKVWEAIKTDDLGENNDKTWVRDKGKNLDHGDAWKADGGVTGLGIDRAATSRHSGTPGFDNGAVKGKVADLADKSDPVVITEIMFGKNTRVPQWIELYNPSKMQAVNLDGWRLEIQNANDGSENLNTAINYELKLPGKRILPNQTILIVSASGDTNDDKRFPSDRVINIWSTRTLREQAEMSNRRDAILSSVGFYIKLSDPDKKLVDEVGNLDGNKRTNDDPAWPLKGGLLVDKDGRSSMVRVEGTEGDGTESDSWRSAVHTHGGEVGVNELYYGDEDDVGTPGYTPGGILPVQLSSFYSKRNDAGAVIITWSTESELDNAGFNLLRSSSRSGEFTKINAQLIPGAGTTGEKNTYTWTDTGAHPNVVYYYQIEDVSLDGAHRTLRTTRLRGHVGAHGKLTTTWGVLKSRD